MYLELNDDDIRLIIKKHFKIELLEDVHCLENELKEKIFGFNLEEKKKERERIALQQAANHLKIETAGQRRRRVDKMIIDLEAKYGDHEVIRELKKIRNNREKAV